MRWPGGCSIGEVLKAWETEGIFALLHELTNCPRIADMAKFTVAIPMLPDAARCWWSSRRLRLVSADDS